MGRRDAAAIPVQETERRQVSDSGCLEQRAVSRGWGGGSVCWWLKAQDSTPEQCDGAAPRALSTLTFGERLADSGRRCTC